jgi:hypothetical protein
MNNIKKFALSIALGFAVTAGAHAADITAGSSSTNTNGSTSTSANQGVNQGITFNSTSPTDTTEHDHVSGITGSNTAIGLGSFSSSFSSDYCGGVAQAGVSAPYITIAAGHPVLGDPGIACVDTRASVHTMEYAATFGNAATKALALADEAAKRSDEADAKSYREAAQQYAVMSGKLATAAVNMLCKLSPDVRDSYTDAGITCPQTNAEKSVKSAQAAEEVKHDAVQRGESTDPLVRARMGLQPLASAQ